MHSPAPPSLECRPTLKSIVTHCCSGLHNGYTILGGKWSKFLLREDAADRDVLRTVDAELALAGFSPNEYMALAIIVECHLGIPGAQVREAHPARQY